MTDLQTFHWFSDLILPLAVFAISLRTWQMVRRSGWHRTLPLLNKYIVFYCLSAILLPLLFHWNWYPERMQRSVCLSYRYLYFTLSPVASLFFLAVLYELLTYTVRNRPEIRIHWIRISMLASVSLAIALGLMALIFSEPAGCCAFEKSANVVSGLGTFTSSGLLLVLFVIKKKFMLLWGRSILLMVLGVAVVCATGIAGMFAVAHDPQLAQSYDLGVQISPLIWLTLWCVALSRAPEFPSAGVSDGALPSVE